MTGQNVECSLENGLVCKGQCFDYEIRIFCDCGDAPKPIPETTQRAVTLKIPVIPIVPVIPVTTPKYEIAKVCDPSVPNVEHPESCNKFLQCVMGRNGSFIYTEKTCGASMMFNPVSMVCDWPTSVLAVKPNCEQSEVPKTQCPVGYVWSECAIPCKRACNYYGTVLTVNGNCTTASNDCLPGCLPADAAVQCEYPKLWRDWKSCVDISACTCFGPNNEQLKPGMTVKISDCKTCQCINNEFICTDTPCVATTRMPIKLVHTTLEPDAEVLITGQRTSQWPQPQSTTKKSVVIVQEVPYYITVCDPSIPHVEHPNSCYKFLHCVPSANGSFVYAVKTCYPANMFNPVSMVCDWPDSVKRLKPSCGIDPGEIEIWEVSERTTTTKRTIQLQVTKPAEHPDYFQDKTPVYIRICDPSVPTVAHPKSCFKYLECKKAPNGSYIYAEGMCQTGSMYNPATAKCDVPSNVAKVNPKCATDPGEQEFWEVIIQKYTRFVVPTTPIGFYGTTTRPTFIQTVTYGPSTWRPVQPTVPARYAYYLTLCDPSVPHIEHPNSCYKFLHCMPAPNGSFVYAVKTCYPDMMYNPVSMTCDWPDSVKKLKPNCGIDPGETEIWEYTSTTPKGPVPIQEVTQTRPTTPPPYAQATDRVVKVVPTTGHVTQSVHTLPPLDRPRPTIPSPIIHTTPAKQVAYYLTLCDPTTPHVEHPNSCYKFLHCMQAPNGSFVYAIKTCYPDMMFNPISMVCDWPDSVKRLKPVCGVNPGEEVIWEYKTTTKWHESYTTEPFTIETIDWGEFTDFPTFSVTPKYFEECDLNITPYNEHFDGCHKFLQCVVSPDGISVYEERSCGNNLFFNPHTGDCDSKANVEAVKPACKNNPGPVGPPEIIGPRPVKPGLVTTRRPPKIKPTRRPTTQAPVPVATESTLTPLILLPSTVTPPMYCAENQMVPLLHLLPASAFSSSSNLGQAFRPDTARLEARPSEGSMGSWSPLKNDLNQYIQIEFPQPIPIYGVIVRGSPLLSQYVTSFKILYSLNGHVYHVMADPHGNPQIFSGSVDQTTPVKNIFPVPTEAKIIRLYPLSWHESIALRLELLGCQRDPTRPITLPPAVTTPPSTTPSYVPPPVTKIVPEVLIPVTVHQPIQPLCDDPLGVENSKLSPNQITFRLVKQSSIKLNCCVA